MNTDDIVEFVTDPLRLTLIIAGVVVVFAILILGRRSNKRREMLYKRYSEKNYSFGSPPADVLVDEEVIVLPRRKKESEVKAEKEPHFSAHHEDEKENLPKAETVEAEAGVDKLSPSIVEKSNKPVILENSKVRKPRNQDATPSVEKAPDNADVQQRRSSKKPKKPAQQFVVLHIIAEVGQPYEGKLLYDVSQSLGMAMGKHNVFHYPADSAYVGDSAFCMVNMTPEGSFDVDHLAETQTNGVSLILTLPTAYSDGLTVFSNMLAVAHALVKKMGGGDIVDQTRMPLTAELVASMQSDIAKFESQLHAPSRPVLET